MNYNSLQEIPSQLIKQLKSCFIKIYFYLCPNINKNKCNETIYTTSVVLCV